MTQQTETTETQEITDALNASSDAYIVRVVENGGFYDLNGAQPTYWDDVRDDVEIIGVVDSPLQGWATDTSDVEMGWTGTDPEYPRSVAVSWKHAVEVQQHGYQYVAFVGFGEMGPAPVTADNVRELLTSTSMEPTMVRWADTGDVEIVAGVLFSDISYVNRNREHEILAIADDLRSQGDWDTENPTADDFAAFAQMLNES